MEKHEFIVFKVWEEKLKASRDERIEERTKRGGSDCRTLSIDSSGESMEPQLFYSIVFYSILVYSVVVYFILVQSILL